MRKSSRYIRVWLHSKNTRVNIRVPWGLTPFSGSLWHTWSNSRGIWVKVLLLGGLLFGSQFSFLHSDIATVAYRELFWCGFLFFSIKFKKGILKTKSELFVKMAFVQASLTIWWVHTRSQNNWRSTEIHSLSERLWFVKRTWFRLNWRSIFKFLFYEYLWLTDTCCWKWKCI